MSVRGDLSAVERGMELSKAVRRMEAASEKLQEIDAELTAAKERVLAAKDVMEEVMARHKPALARVQVTIAEVGRLLGRSE